MATYKQGFWRLKMISMKIIDVFAGFPKISAFKGGTGMFLKVLTYSLLFDPLYLCHGVGRGWENHK